LALHSEKAETPSAMTEYGINGALLTCARSGEEIDESNEKILIIDSRQYIVVQNAVRYPHISARGDE
jgi:hypothetical protein